MSDLSLTTILEMAIGGKLAGVRVALPGRVVSYDADLQQVNAQILIKDGYEAETSERRPSAPPQVNDVPVQFKRGGGYSETFPLEPGDPVLLVFCSSSIARWKPRGGLVDPGDDRHH